MSPSMLPTLLAFAVLLPLCSFWVILLFARQLGKAAAYVAIGAIGGSAFCSYVCLLLIWLPNHWPAGLHHEEHPAPAHVAVASGPQYTAVLQEADDTTLQSIAAIAKVPEALKQPTLYEFVETPLKDVAEYFSDLHGIKLVLQEDQLADAGVNSETPITKWDKGISLETALTSILAEKNLGFYVYNGQLRVTTKRIAEIETQKTYSDAPHLPVAKNDQKSDESHGNHSKSIDRDHGHSVTGPAYTGEYYLLGQFGNLRLTISYYIDSLTICMFCMVTLIATLIHCYAMGYMHDELHDITDHEVTTSDGKHLHRPGRFPRFFQYLSLFCFSMLGLVLAGNIAMVFVFWELVGICSYFLIGFYIERKSASNAANKAFIVNRVGDFGMLIGLMALWSSLGTFAFGDIDRDANGHIEKQELGLFSLVRPADSHHALIVPDEMVWNDSQREVAGIFRDHAGNHESAQAELRSRTAGMRESGAGYWLLVVAGIGIFCGCVGKSAQFPLHTWLPDAMEGPTPVSALVHSATMVAAGVYLVGRFFPVFAPEALLVIASIGCITLFLAASIAITAVDIKRVLAYSTVSQLGYMMLALGVGGWSAGMMHLITHAFFKSLLFMCSGSVIHAVHTNDMRKMGGLLKKMPVTAITMLVGCLAIAGVGVPFVIGFSAYYSKDAILEQAFLFSRTNNSAWAGIFFYAASGGAALTSFYMFRMWYMTFVGKPRDQKAYDHAHESPALMFMPLVILSFFAVAVAWNTRHIGYAIVPIAYLIFLGLTHGWFQKAAGGHGHDDHGHGHDDHGHDTHGHDDHHAPAHASHGHDDHSHGHDDHGGSARVPEVSWATLAVLFVATLVVGGSIAAIIPEKQDSTLSLANLLEQARPAGILADAKARWLPWTWPNEHDSHAAAVKVPVTWLATGTWLLGIGLATVMYGIKLLNPADVRRAFEPIYQLLWNKWFFDELYDFIFVKPTHVAARFISNIDREWIDRLLNGLASCTVTFAKWWDYVADRTIVDGVVNMAAGWLYSLGLSLRVLQTGRLRQYVMFIVIGAIALFVLVTFFWTPTFAK